MTPAARLRCVACTGVFLGLALAIRVEAGIEGFMGDTALLPAGRHRILILEYDSPQRSLWGRDLARLLSRQTLGSMTGVSGVGVIALHQPARRVLLSPSRVELLARQQRAQVVLWGEFYESPEAVYLHSHLRVVPDAERFGEPDLELVAQVPGSAVRVSAAPPTLQVDFAPIALSRSLLDRLHPLAETSATLLDRPWGRPVGTLRLHETYMIRRVRDKWIQVTAGGRAGWIRFDLLGEEDQLTGLEGVVRFAQGLTQYLDGSFGAAEATFAAYLSRNGRGEDNMNLAMARILRANARLRRLGAGASIDEEILSDYLGAAKLLPNAASPVNHLAFALLRRHASSRGFVPELRDLEERLIHAIQAQGDLRAVRNLQALYRVAGPKLLLKRPEDSDKAYGNAIARQLRLLQNLEKKLSQLPG
jgi:hypothetical protein